MPLLTPAFATRALLWAALAAAPASTLPAQVTTTFTSSTTDKEPAVFNWSPRLSNQTTRRFDVLGFQIAESGTYNLVNTNIGGWDHFFALHIGAFDPSRPEQNNLWWCDICSPFNITLQAGTSYFGVTTGWSTATGDYRLAITGPSTATLLSDVAPPATPPSDRPPVVPVPEPSAVALLLAGSTLLLLRTRRQARVR